MLLDFRRVCLLFVISLPSLIMGRTCPSMDIRNKLTEFNQLKGCTVIDGFLHVVLIDFALPSNFTNVSFPELREVTEYVLFFRVTGLYSLGKLFPNLAVIRGEQLFADYSLIVFQMPHVQELAFKSLVILRGSVVIANNKNLCYDDTIDWEKVAMSGVREYLFPNSSKHECDACLCPNGHCWSRTVCQDISNETSSCHPECVGGCTGSGPSDCVSCRHFNFKGKCIKSCPPGYYSFNLRYCITKQDCINPLSYYHKMRRNDGITRKWFLWNNTCVTECPPKYEMTNDGSGCKRCARDLCKKSCPAATVDSFQAAQNLRDCTHIEGSLEISIGTGKQDVVAKELEENLGMIEEIDGQLKIIRSFPLISLGFLKNLKVIRGETSDRYYKGINHSLFVLDNQNLQEIWNWETRPGGRNFKILKGRPFFHFNPKLCLKHIEELTSIAGIENVTSIEVARDSNGGRFACKVLSLNVSVHLVFNSSLVLAIQKPDQEHLGKYHNLMRLVTYYKEAPFQNVTEPIINECSESIWKMKDINSFTAPYEEGPPNGTIFHLITGLKAYTQYAYYVKTYTVDSTGVQSPIQYVRTAPSQPKMPARVDGISNSSSEIVLNWKPPEVPNGKLISYTVSGFVQDHHPSFLSSRDFCKKPYKHIPPTAPPPKFMTHAKATNKCNCDKNDGMDDFDLMKDPVELCDSPDKILDSSPSYEYDGCHKYIYEVIENLSFHTYDDENLDNLRFERGISMKDDDYDVVLNERPLEIKDQNDKFVKFYRIFPSETEFATIGNLKHFTTYTIEVKACRERTPHELIRSDNCSTSAFVTVKTLPDISADNINDGLEVTVENRTAILKWEPPKANGMTLSYQIKLIRTDRDDTSMVECVPVQDVENGMYILRDLEIGTYGIQIRSLSLYSYGNYTDIEYFSISEYTVKDVILITVSVVIICLVFLFFALSIWYYRKKLMVKPVVIASVNPEYCGLLVFDEEWELPRERVRIGKELKRGNFGIVCEGILIPEGKVVAVKKAIADENQDVNFLHEANIMKQFVNGPHIVKLIGVVSRDSPQLVVMEMMTNGDLKTYLRESRDHIPPSPQRMILMATQIADGMAYLEHAKFVHRDLAARNCMVSDTGVVKIGDFGMTRDIYETDYYRKGNKGLLPIRWMAPESLNEGVFTSKSDAWSYGIVLWEMSTLASQPYQGLSNDQVLQYVVSGNKLELPPVYPKPFKSLMTWCWKWKPKFRPTFIEILRELEEYMTVSFRQVSFFNSEIGLQARGAIPSEPISVELQGDSVSFRPHPETD